MKLWNSEPDRITYRTLINGLESLGEMDLSAKMRLEAENDYGDLWDYLDEEEMIETWTRWVNGGLYIYKDEGNTF